MQHYTGDFRVNFRFAQARHVSARSFPAELPRFHPFSPLVANQPPGILQKRAPPALSVPQIPNPPPTPLSLFPCGRAVCCTGNSSNEAFLRRVNVSQVLSDGDILVSAEGMDLRCRTMINCAGLSAVALAGAVKRSNPASLPVAFFAKGNYFRYAGVLGWGGGVVVCLSLAKCCGEVSHVVVCSRFCG